MSECDQVTEKELKTPKTLSRRFCVAPMMESKNSGQKFVSACHPSGVLSTHFHNLPDCRTSRSHHHVHGGDGRRRRRHGRDLNLLTAVFRKPNVFAYIVVMLTVGLVFDAAMRGFQHRFIRWAEE
jgi:hypothetical protein